MILDKMDFKEGGTAAELVSINKSISAALSVFAHPVTWTPTNELTFLGRIDIFELALLELLKNASEAIQSAGRGVIAIQLDEIRLELWVEDTACAISACSLERIFEERFSTNLAGNGLGLYFCRMVLRDWGGDIRCLSKEGEWTRFVL